MQLQPRHIQALIDAEASMFHCDFCPYLELKEMLADPSDQSRQRTRTLFIKNYDLKRAHLKKDFEDAFFTILFQPTILVNGKPDFAGIFGKLSAFKTKKGKFAIHFSFVSKLVAMHLESSPICDRHVLAFFRRALPDSRIAAAQRVSRFVEFLNEVSQSYAAWAELDQIAAALDNLKKRDPRLAQCHTSRLMDFLVWKVGSLSLLPK